MKEKIENNNFKEKILRNLSSIKIQITLLIIFLSTALLITDHITSDNWVNLITLIIAFTYGAREISKYIYNNGYNNKTENRDK